MSASARGTTLTVGGQTVRPAERRVVEIPVGRLSTGTWLTLPVEVLNGAAEGTGIWLSGAVHGDEVVGVEIIRRVLAELDAADLAGHVIAAPVVNVFGFVAESRYLPDRRDLNRSFPGSKNGSLASRLARLFMDEVVDLCGYGLDFHAGSDDRTNLPQIRCDLDDPETRSLASAFGAPIMIHGSGPKGSLRTAAGARGVRVLLYEGGEPRRFGEEVVRAGVGGTLSVLAALGMVAGGELRPPTSHESLKTGWVRASRGGILRLETELGARVTKGQRLGSVSGPLERDERPVTANRAGLVIGHTVNPVVHLGDALIHIAELTAVGAAGRDPPGLRG